MHVTPEHPFWVDGRGWTAALELVPGDRLGTADGGAVTVQAKTGGQTALKVHNFEVEGMHSYFVGLGHEWVHNACPIPITRFIEGVKVKSFGKVIAEGTADLQPTLERIEAGGSFPHHNDGAVFKNKGVPLPAKPNGYYKEFVHPTPGVPGAGPQRVITGQGGEIFYSPDHYETFLPVKQ